MANETPSLSSLIDSSPTEGKYEHVLGYLRINIL
jgi:hypothetical protein